MKSSTAFVLGFMLGFIGTVVIGTRNAYELEGLMALFWAVPFGLLFGVIAAVIAARLRSPR